ncbi:Vitamin B12-binding protein [anaerobic digester metagenome]
MKKKLMSLMVALSVLVVAPVLSACGAATTQTAGAAGSGNYEKLTFDNYGREVVVEKMPEKVLTLGPNCSELFVALGLSDKIVGNSLDNHSRGPLPEYATAYNKIPELNYTNATREAVISSGADFIYGIDWEFGGDGLNPDELKDYGMTVYMESATTLEDIYQEITDLGKIFKVEDKAADFIADQQKRIEAVSKKVEGQGPVKVMVYDSGNAGVLTCTGTNFETLLINEAGGKNVFDDITEKQWMRVSYEEILKRNPDVIVIHDYDSPSVEEKIAEIKANPSLAQLDAVKNERFVIMELESVLPGDRMAYAVEKFAKGFYPNLF